MFGDDDPDRLARIVDAGQPGRPWKPQRLSPANGDCCSGAVPWVVLVAKSAPPAQYGLLRPGRGASLDDGEEIQLARPFPRGRGAGGARVLCGVLGLFVGRSVLVWLGCSLGLSLPHRLLRQRHEPPEELVPRIRVIPDPRQHVERDGLDHVEEEVVVGGVIHAGERASLSRPRRRAFVAGTRRNGPLRKHPVWTPPARGMIENQSRASLSQCGADINDCYARRWESDVGYDPVRGGARLVVFESPQEGLRHVCTVTNATGP